MAAGKGGHGVVGLAPGLGLRERVNHQLLLCWAWVGEGGCGGTGVCSAAVGVRGACQGERRNQRKACRSL